MASHADFERQRAKARRALEEPADAKRAREAREAWLKACASGDAFAAEAAFKDGLVPIETAATPPVSRARKTMPANVVP